MNYAQVHAMMRYLGVIHYVPTGFMWYSQDENS